MSDNKTGKARQHARFWGVPKSHVLDAPSLRRKAQADPTGMAYALQDLVDSGDLTFDNLGDNLGIRGLYSALKDIPVTVAVRDPVDGGRRDITSTLMALTLGGMTIAEMNMELESLDSIADQLVTDRESNKPTLTIPGVLLQDVASHGHKEDTPYPLVSASDERYDIGERPQGVRMRITEKAVRQDDVGMVTTLARKFARIPELDKEEYTLALVTDFYGSRSSGQEPYVLHLARTATSLYSATADQPGVRASAGTCVQNNSLTGYTALENARVRLMAMRDENDRPVNNSVNNMILLVPDAVVSLASRLLNSEFIPGENAPNEINDWGPRGRYRPRLLSSNWLDAKFSSSAWYLGDFKRQFVRKISQQLRFLSISGPGFVDYVRSGVLMEMSYSWDWAVGAVTYDRVVQSLSATTFPADE